MEGPGAEEHAALARLRNPDLRFPPLPRIVPDLDHFTMPDGLGIQFRGGETPVIIRGRFAEATLRFLLPLLDGTHTVEGLLARCPPGVPGIVVLRALELLHRKGLLTSADDVHASQASHGTNDKAMHRQLLYWGRHLDLTRSARSATAVQQRLTAARIVLVGTGMFGITTYDLLTRSGCGNVAVLDWNDDGFLHATLAASPTPPRELVHLNTTAVDRAAKQVRTWADDADLIVTATCDAPAALFRALNRIALSRQTPWLHGNVSGSQAEIGPYVLPDDSGCYRCMELRRASVQDFAIEEHLYQEHLAEERDAAMRVPLGESLWAATLAASLLVGEVIRSLTELALPTLLNTVLQLHPVSGDLQANTFLRVPRCPDCYGGEIHPHAVTDEMMRREHAGAP